MAGWKTVRVFISSTFRDMHAKRDHLIKVAFPALRESLVRDRIYLDDIDLRCGVTKEQAEKDRVLDLCLKQIDGCRSFFIGILGERYG
jgi:telomerase protein component 1